MQSKFNLAKELAISHSAASSKVAICRECAMGLTTLAEFFFLFGRGLYAILPKSQTIGCVGYAFQSRNIEAHFLTNRVTSVLSSSLLCPLSVLLTLDMRTINSYLSDARERFALSCEEGGGKEIHTG